MSTSNVCLSGKSCSNQVRYVETKAKKLKDSLQNSLNGILKKEKNLFDLSKEERWYLQPVFKENKKLTLQDIKFLNLLISQKDFPLPESKYLGVLFNTCKRDNEILDNNIHREFEKFFSRCQYITTNEKIWSQFYQFIGSTNLGLILQFINHFHLFLREDYELFLQKLGDFGFSNFLLLLSEEKFRSGLINLLNFLNSLSSFSNEDTLDFLDNILVNEDRKVIEVFSSEKLNESDFYKINKALHVFSEGKAKQLKSILAVIIDFNNSEKNYFLDYLHFIAEYDIQKNLKFKESLLIEFYNQKDILNWVKWFDDRRLNEFKDIIQYFLFVSDYYALQECHIKSFYYTIFLYLKYKINAVNDIIHIDSILTQYTNFYEFSKQMLIYLFFKENPPDLFLNNYKNWSEQEYRFLEWIVSGEKIREFHELPFPITKKQVYLFYTKYRASNTPEFTENILANIFLRIKIEMIYDYSYFIHHIKDVNPTVENFKYTFWEEIARFFKNYKKDIPFTEIRNILDYFIHKKRVDSGFSIKGFTVQSVRRRVTAWHEELAQERRGINATRANYSVTNRYIKWDGVKISDSVISDNDQTYKIMQLKDADSLYKEGKELKHCVASYASDCRNGSCSIWSLRNISNNKPESLITIQLRRNTIVQAKGKYNRLPNISETAIIRYWARDEGLKINCYEIE